MTLTPEQWRALGQRTQILGRQLFWIDSGGADKPVLLLLHGYPTSSWDWAPLWAELTAKFRVLTLDMLGFGFSDKPNPHRYRIMEQADLCEALLRYANIGTFDLLVHDYGVTVAQELLARFNAGDAAGSIRSLCFLNGGLFPEMHRARLIQRLLLSPLGPLVGRLSSKRTFDRSFSAVFGPDTQPSPDDLAHYWRIINEGEGRHMFHNLIRYMPDRIEHRQRWVDALSGTTIPLALINGSLDPVSGAHLVEYYRSTISRDHFVAQLAHVGHYPHVEDPNAVLEAYLCFVAAQTNAGG